MTLHTIWEEMGMASHTIWEEMGRQPLYYILYGRWKGSHGITYYMGGDGKAVVALHTIWEEMGITMNILTETSLDII